MDWVELLSGIGNFFTKNRQDRSEPHTWYYPHHPTFENPNNAENLSPVNQRTNPQQAKDPLTAKLQTRQPETKRQVLTGALFTQRPPETPAVTIKAPLKFNRPPNESLGDENEPLLDKDIMPHTLSAESPDKKFKCCDKLNETGSPNESHLAKTPPDNPRTPLDGPREKSAPL